jgi:hypothetical protein
MSKDWRIILRFALLGFGIGTVFAAQQALIDSGTPNLSMDAVLIVLCPVSLLFMPLSVYFFEAAEIGAPGFYVLWALIALANAALYTVIGAAYVGIRKKREGGAAN